MFIQFNNDDIVVCIWNLCLAHICKEWQTKFHTTDFSQK